MTEPASSRETAAEPGARDAPEGAGAPAYEGPGGWGTAAMALLIGLFLVSVGLTVHSLVATFGAG